MGQRLNIEIVSGGEVIANAYYHWSAYTRSAIGLAKEAIAAYEHLANQCKDELALAIRMLEETGAGVNEIERARIKRDPKFSEYSIRDCQDRNKGKI